jgi:hypothetical protein
MIPHSRVEATKLRPGRLPGRGWLLLALGPARPGTAQDLKAMARYALATSTSGVALPSLHSSQLAPTPEPTIATGILATTSAILDLMES